MKRRVALVILATFTVALASGTAWAHHSDPPQRYVLPLGLGHVTTSMETTKGDAQGYGMECTPSVMNDPLKPNSTPCYSDYQQNRTGTGGTANKEFLSGYTGGGTPLAGESAGPFHWGGVYFSEDKTPSGSGRAWTSLIVDGAATVSAGGGGSAAQNGHPAGCVNVFYQDQTPGTVVVHTLAQATPLPTPAPVIGSRLWDNPNDPNTDTQACGVVGG